MTLVYRSPQPDDAEALVQLGRETFVQTFRHLYRDEDLQPFLGQNYTAEGWRAQIEDPAYLFYLAEDAGRMVGYCKLGRENDFPGDFRGRKVMAFHQLYVRDDYKGQGIAKTLMDWARATAIAQGYTDLMLSVFSENPRAIRFYEKQGWTFHMHWYFMVGKQRDEELLYRLRLVA